MFKTGISCQFLAPSRRPTRRYALLNWFILSLQNCAIGSEGQYWKFMKKTDLLFPIQLGEKSRLKLGTSVVHNTFVYRVYVFPNSSYQSESARQPETEFIKLVTSIKKWPAGVIDEKHVACTKNNSKESQGTQPL